MITTALTYQTATVLSLFYFKLDICLPYLKERVKSILLLIFEFGQYYFINHQGSAILEHLHTLARCNAWDHNSIPSLAIY